MLHAAMPAAPSELSAEVTRLMQPALPEAWRLDISVAAEPPRVVVSAYPPRAGGAAGEGYGAPTHAAAAAPSLERGVARAETAQRLCTDLAAKLRLHVELRSGRTPPAAQGRSAVI